MLTAKQKVTKARIQLLTHSPFFAILALRMELIEKPDVKTMATDGINLFFSPVFVNSLIGEELMGVVCHEVLHVTNLHHLRRNSRNPRKWNQACDYAINPLILESGFKLPANGLLDKRFEGMSAERIYSLLPDEEEDGNGQSDGSDPGGCGGVLDAPSPEESGKEWSDLEAEVKQAVTQASLTAKQQGKLPGHLEELIKELVQTKVNWREVLARFISVANKEDYTFRKPNSRYLHSGFYLPSLYSETLGNIWLITDTSISMDYLTLQEVASDMQAISAQFNRPIEVLYVDTKVQGRETIEPDRTDPLRPKGRGGTDFRPGFDWLEEQDIQPIAVVYLTDGECSSFPSTPDYDVLWAIYDGKRSFSPPFGEVIFID